MTDDAALVELAQSGDASAFAELYERYFDRIHDFLARMVRDRAEAADLAQDTFLRAMNSISTLHNGASFKSWLFTIARNTALNRLERASRTRPLERTNDEGDEYSYDVVDSDRFGSPEEATEAASLAALVWEAAAALEPRYYSVLHLTVREGMDSAEIAEAMGVTRNNAYVLVNRMKKALEDAVGALALFRGRRQCAELDAALAHHEVGGMSPEARRLIERHASGCDDCTERRTRLASPFAAFAALAPIHAEASVKASVLAHVHAAFEAGAGLPGGAGGGSAGSGGTGSGGTGSGGTGSGGTGSGGTGSGGAGPIGSPESLVWPPPGSDETVIEGGRGSSSVTANTLDGRGRLRRWGPRVGAGGAALLLLIGAPIAAFAILGGGDGDGSPTPTPTPTVTATSSTVTPTAVPILVTSTVAPTGSATPTSTPVAIEGSPGSSLRSGSGATPTPEASQRGGQPPLPAPPTEAPPTEAPSTATPVPTSTPVPPTATPACTPQLTATPSQLTFSGGSRTQTVQLKAIGCALEFAAVPSAGWLSASPVSGSIAAGGVATLLVTVDSGDRSAKSGRVQLTGSGGTVNVFVTVLASTPTPTSTPCSGINCPGGGLTQ
jgi:RNA polymerase sigma factor (sigma-70 family)